jgi:hypothetical protein
MGDTTPDGRWSVRDTVTVDGETVKISTVELPTTHGDHTHETCLFFEDDSRVVERYATREQAIAGHEDTCEAVERGAHSSSH